MSKIKRKKYTKEFKIEAVEMMLSKVYKPKEVVEMLGVDRQTIYRWVKEYKAKGESAFNGTPMVTGSEINRLRKEVETLRMENEILKKAKAYFAKMDEPE